MSTITLITGASRGLGRNTALCIARGGGDVILTYRQEEQEAQAVVAAIEALGRKAVALRLDTAQAATFPAFTAAMQQALSATWSRATFDHLVNNAGHGDSLVNVHFKGVFFLTQAMLPLLADGGRIVNLSTGLTGPCFPGYAAYAAAKGAVEVLTRYLAKELGARGIAVNTVAPGAIATDFGGGTVRDNAEVNQLFAGITALGRAGVPDDIGPMIASLLAPANRWVNGQRIEVSGGQGI
jgi:NAD(P)-dependent dehydrogenase (short-subunit alcohol dehydrogenase family)